MNPEMMRIDVARSGTAVVITRADGHRHLVRRADMAAVLGLPVATDDRVALIREAALMAGATPSADAIGLDFDDGTSAEVPLSACPPWSARDATPAVLEHIGLLLTADSAGASDAAADTEAALGLIRDAALVIRAGRVEWLGPQSELSRCGLGAAALKAARRIDAGGRLVTPGLIDCHAHPIFAGDRAAEFAKRAAGASYLDIASAGGGIRATVEPTRAASFADHLALAKARMSRALAAGTTTCEAKSGYDLRVDGELGLLAVARALDSVHPVDISPTLLGAHVIPPEYQDDHAGYVRAVIEQMIPRAAAGDTEPGARPDDRPPAEPLAEAADVYCDEGAFTLAETRAILRAAADAGLAVRAHVGQFADLGGAQLVAELGGRSVDHLEQVSADGIAALAARGVAAVMLPGACVQLRMDPPPVAALRSAGVALALASDQNPGTSLCETLPIQMWLATTHYGMTVSEAWLGVTRVAAQVLGRADVGRLAPGMRADVALWDAEHPAEIPYHYGAALCRQVLKDGRTVYQSK
ncbi:MAG: imidazolonepropionase [Haliangiales bacterium]